MNDSRIKMLEQSATNAAIAWAKSGVGYENMKRAVNDYIEATGVNRAINLMRKQSFMADEQQRHGLVSMPSML